MTQHRIVKRGGVRYEHAVDALIAGGVPLVGFIVAGFLAGSIPFGLLLALTFGKIDVRTAGSGNIGATNVARTAGKKLGVVTLVLDAVKGALPTLAVTAVWPLSDDVRVVAAHGATVGLFALLGHCFTPWLRGKGGKGVATGLGMLTALHPEIAAYGLLAFAVAFAASRLVSVSSLTAAVVVVAGLIWRGPVDAALVPVVVAVLVIVARHKENMQRLVKKQELRL